MPTLGEELRRRREQQGITLAEISEATRIGTRFLKAIEDNNFSVLPGGIYTRNFIRSYAERVGMSEDEAIAVYQQQMTGQTGDLPVTGQHDQLRVVPVDTRSRRAETIRLGQRKSRTNWSTIVIAAGIVLIVLIIVISLVQRLNRANTPQVEPSSGISTQSESPTEPNGGQPDKTSTGGGPAAAPQPTEAPALIEGEPIRVRLEATTDPSDIQFWIDDESKSSHLLINPGEAQVLPPARNQVRLSIGNRVGLKMIINDREATFPSDTQKFRARIAVTRENLEMFFPQQVQ